MQKAGDQVRVNVQLLNAQTDFHLWADTYDRKLVDIFSVESEIARAIADALQAKLSGGEQRALAVKPTNNPEAYDAYLRGLALEARTTTSPDDSEKAVGFYELGAAGLRPCQSDVRPRPGPFAGQQRCPWCSRPNRPTTRALG